MNSRQKGKRGERLWRDELRANGYAARRGQQFSGSPDSPDVICDALPWIHFEVKAVEKLNIEDAMEQARRDSVAPSGQSKTPFVAHKRSFRPWLVTMDAETFFKFLRGELPPQMDTDTHGLPQRGAKISSHYPHYLHPSFFRTSETCHNEQAIKTNLGTADAVPAEGKTTTKERKRSSNENQC